jgi:hypothetical protein
MRPQFRDRAAARLAMIVGLLATASFGCGSSSHVASSSGGSQTEVTANTTPTPPATTDVETKPDAHRDRLASGASATSLPTPDG